jgi:hypothetical protein
MTTEPVYCEVCRYAQKYLVNPGGKRTELPVRAWLCMQAPRDDRNNFVSRKMRVEDPFYRCSIVNTNGECRRFDLLPGASDV